MADLSDIPSRDGKDGSEQLALLRAYLKDNDSGEQTYQDDYLINYLVVKAPAIVWSEFAGEDSETLPFTYDPLDMTGYINRVRLLTDDTVELSLKYTDIEILKFLEVIPLRYVCQCINARTLDSITYPSDPDHPLHILRKYLEDESGEKYTDKELVDLLFEKGTNPFGIILDLMERQTSSKLVTQSNDGQGLASIDGISFTSPTDEASFASQSRDAVMEHSVRSVYHRDSIYGVYVDDLNTTDIDWEHSWYGL